MNNSTDPLRLNEHRLFRELRNSLPKNIKDTRNIVDIRDNMLYVWNANDFCVMTLNIGQTRGKNDDVSYQRLRPVDPPIFEIKHLLVNEIGTQLVLWSNLGLVIMELPKRWRDGVFQGGKEDILCVNHQEAGDIRKAKWHPGSANNSHLLVLTGENTFRFYDCEMGSKPRVIKSWKVGRVPLNSPSKIPDFSSLGDTAVDFDFSTPTIRKSKIKSNSQLTWDQIEWPILVLRGNGEVVIVHGNILHDSHETPVVSGSLSMYPAVDDNYGTDSCSIMCIPTTPPIVVIAMSTGKLYHAILLKDERADDSINDSKSWAQCTSSYSFHAPEEALYVYECVEIELGLFFTDSDEKYNCPIYLRSDNGNKSRYFCSHNAGIHMISLPMVSQLEEYISAPDGNADDRLPSLSNHSNSQYLICRRTKHTEANEATPILGFGLVQEPCVLVALLHTGDVVARPVIDLFYFPKLESLEPVVDRKETVSSNDETSDSAASKDDFNMYIKKLLKRKTSQPIIKIGNQTVSPKECLQLLYHATDIFRKEHFAKHDAVREEIGKKARALTATKTRLPIELDALLETKKELRQTAERLAERYEDIKYEQEKLAQRAKEVLRLVNYKEHCMTPIERLEAEELRRMEIKIEELKIKLLELKRKWEQQTEFIESNASTEKKQEIIHLKSDQERIIKNNLGYMAKDIKELISEVKKLQEEVST